MSDEIGLLHSWVDGHADEIVEALRGVLRIPSKKEPPAGHGAPFGQPVRDALDYTLSLCRDLGFQVKDVDGYAGHAEMGDGDEMIAALGHLDVVPEGERWEHPPYGAEIDGGYIYARGASDDKGPTYAALFGAKAIMESGLPLKRRIRIIFGCDEESGFGCVRHYFEVAQEERPLYAFTPDAYFPLIYAEKGITNLTLEWRPGPLAPNNGGTGGLRVTQATGGTRNNVVPDSASARVEGPAEALYAAVIALQKHWDGNIEVEAQPDGLWVRAAGKSAHGSTPQVGDNAVVRLARALLALDLPEDRAWLEWIDQTADAAGLGLGIRGEDEVAGELTNNLGILAAGPLTPNNGGTGPLTSNNGGTGKVVRLVYNIRYPVTWTIDTLLGKARPVIEAAGMTLAEHTDSPPLYVPLDQEPVSTLLRVYQLETGDTASKPGTMGGGTYARATPRAVAYGAAFPTGADGPPHEPDERIAIDSLLRATKIYAHALYELAR